MKFQIFFPIKKNMGKLALRGCSLLNVVLLVFTCFTIRQLVQKARVNTELDSEHTWMTRPAHWMTCCFVVDWFSCCHQGRALGG